MRIKHFPPKRLAASCSSHEVMFSSPEDLHHCETLHLAPCRRSHMNISRHIKNIGFIHFKFLNKFPSKQQLSGFLSTNCQSTNLIFDRKIQFSLYFFCFFVKSLIGLNAKSSSYTMLFCFRNDYFELLPAGIVHQDVEQNFLILKSFRGRIYNFYCSQPNSDWGRNWNQSFISFARF